MGVLKPLLNGVEKIGEIIKTRKLTALNPEKEEKRKLINDLFIKEQELKGELEIWFSQLSVDNKDYVINFLWTMTVEDFLKKDLKSNNENAKEVNKVYSSFLNKNLKHISNDDEAMNFYMNKKEQTDVYFLGVAENLIYSYLSKDNKKNEKDKLFLLKRMETYKNRKYYDEDKENSFIYSYLNNDVNMNASKMFGRFEMAYNLQKKYEVLRNVVNNPEDYELKGVFYVIGSCIIDLNNELTEMFDFKGDIEKFFQFVAKSPLVGDYEKCYLSDLLIEYYISQVDHNMTRFLENECQNLLGMGLGKWFNIPEGLDFNKVSDIIKIEINISNCYREVFNNYIGYTNGMTSIQMLDNLSLYRDNFYCFFDVICETYEKKAGILIKYDFSQFKSDNKNQEAKEFIIEREGFSGADIKKIMDLFREAMIVLSKELDYTYKEGDDELKKELINIFEDYYENNQESIVEEMIMKIDVCKNKESSKKKLKKW